MKRDAKRLPLLWAVVSWAVASVPACTQPAPVSAPPPVVVAAGPTPRPWVLTTTATSTNSSSLIYTTDDETWILGGRWRYELTASPPAAGMDFPGAELTGMALNDEGNAAFLVRFGSVLRAPSFTGPLTAMHGSDRSFKAIAMTDDHLFACDSDGDLFVGSAAGDPGLRRTQVHCSAIKAEGNTVWIVGDDGALSYLKSDGPMAARRVAAGPAVFGWPGPPWVSIGDSDWWLREDGSLVSKPKPEDDGLIGFSGSPFRDPRHSALADAAQVGAEFVTATRTDGGFATAPVRGKAGAGAPTTPDLAQAEPPCVKALVSDATTVLCAVEGEDWPDLGIYERAGDGWALRERRAVDGFVLGTWGQEVDLFDDGTVIVSGGCDEDYVEDAVCVITPDSSVTHRLPPPEQDLDLDARQFTTVVAVAGRIAMLSQPGNPGQIRLNTATGQQQTVGTAHSWRAIGDTILWFQRGRDAPGSVRWVDDDGERSNPTPQGMTAVGFATKTHFLGVGKTADHVWTTTDAGEHWEAQSIPVRGDPAAVHFAPTAPGHIQCGPFACAAPPVLWAHPDLLEAMDYESPTIVAPQRPRN